MYGRDKPILHLEDWKTPDGNPTAVVHTTTRNKSFIRMHSLLKKMGIKNNLFHLSLLDPTLLKVEPEKLNDETDPDMTLRLKVAAECLKNPWYFFREICKIPAQGGPPVKFELHRGNLAMLWCFLSHFDITLTQPRQTGKSIVAVALCAYMLYLRGYKMRMSMLTLSTDIRQENVKRLKDIRDALPPYLLHETSKDVDNKEGLGYDALGNRYLTYTGQKGEEDARNVGRGSSAVFLHVDEGPFIRNVHISLPVIKATTTAARETAKKAGQYHTDLFTTTAGDPTTQEGQYMKEYIDKAMPFSEKLYDTKDEETAHRIVKANSQNGLINATFSYLQLGRDHGWLQDQINRTNASKTEIDRDYLNKWISHTQNPILCKEITDKMYQNRKDDPDYVELWGDYAVKWYVPSHEVQNGFWTNKSIVMGFDGSELIGRDYTTCVGVDPSTLKTLFTFGCNTSNLSHFSVFVGDFLLTYKKCLWVPETKSTARGIIDTVILQLKRANQNPFRRIFNRIVDNRHLMEFAKYNLEHPTLIDQANPRRLLGFMTTGKSRPVLYKSILQKAAENAADKVYDPTLIGELVSLQSRNGRLDHSVGGHDDMVMAWLLAMYVIFEGKNLSYYGINSLDILREVKTDGTSSSRHIEQQESLRKTISFKMEEIRKTSNPYTKRIRITELERLIRQLDTSLSISPITPDSLKKEDFDIKSIIEEINKMKRDIQKMDFVQGPGNGLY